MARARKVFGVILIILALGVGALALTLSHDSACGSAPPLPDGAQRMKAAVYRCYGSPDVVKVEEIAKPTPNDNQVLIKVHAASVNPLDWHTMTGKPYIMRMDEGVGAPKNPQLGVDFAGTVEAVGSHVTRFHPGDEVLGGRNGAFAEYIVMREKGPVVLKPASVSFEQAAAVPIAALTALQALRNEGNIQAGQKVLINGASGGVGTFAVQIAKSFGADVTGVCSTRNVDMVRALGADHVVDYTKEDFTQGTQRYDLIFDTVGNHSMSDYRRVMNPKAVFVIVGAPSDDPWLAPLTTMLKAPMIELFVSQKFGMMMADLNQKDLTTITELMQAGKVTSVIDRRYPLTQVPEAIRYLEAGHARGKVVIDVD
jgi:NADPH:quinone reductase-like Zn-dependent oxidoreductase